MCSYMDNQVVINCTYCICYCVIANFYNSVSNAQLHGSLLIIFIKEIIFLGIIPEEFQVVTVLDVVG